MKSLVIRDLVLMLAGNLLSLCVIFLYPDTSGFTVSLKSGTRFIQGGVFLAVILTSVISIPVIANLLFRVWKVR